MEASHRFALRFYDKNAHNINLSAEFRQRYSSFFATLINNQNLELRSELINLATYFGNENNFSDDEIAQRICTHIDNKKTLGSKM